MLHPDIQACESHVKEDYGIDALETDVHHANRTDADGADRSSHCTTCPKHHEKAPEEQDGWAFATSNDTAKAAILFHNAEPPEVGEDVAKNDLHATDPGSIHDAHLSIHDIDDGGSNGHHNGEVQLEDAPLPESRTPVGMFAGQHRFEMVAEARLLHVARVFLTCACVFLQQFGVQEVQDTWLRHFVPSSGTELEAQAPLGLDVEALLDPSNSASTRLEGAQATYL